MKKPATPAESQPRYPGLRSFGLSPLDQALFFGRQQETQDLTQYILGNRLTVVYGKSGLGKTSLLQAGVFPELRARGFLPLRMRLAGEERRPLALLLEEMKAELAREQQLDASVDISSGSDATDWWTFFKDAVFWQGARVATPCLVVDQFEEVFTLYSLEERSALAQQLSHLVNDTVPPAVLEQMRAGDSAFSDEPPKLRIVLSLRTEYVGQLQELFPRIPAILTRRFIISPLDRKRAEQAIVEPARLPGEQFTSRPFAYEPDALQLVLEHLGGKDTGDIEPYQLQLQCQEIEHRVVNRQRKGEVDVRVDSQLIGLQEGLDTVVRQFYRAVIEGVGDSACHGNSGMVAAWRSWRARHAARALCELGLLSGEGHRWPLSEGQIRQEYPTLASDQLSYLVEQRLLRKEARGNTYVYELAHDCLAGPVGRERSSHLSPQTKKRMIAGALVAATIIVSLLVYNYYLSEQKQILAQQKMVLAEFELNARGKIEEYRKLAKIEIENLKDRNSQLAEQLDGANVEIEELIDSNERTLEALKLAKTEGTISKAQAEQAYRKLDAEAKTLRQAQQARVAASAALKSSGFEGPEMVDIEAGSFRMGCHLDRKSCNQSELPITPVDLTRFRMGRYEVSFDNYDPFALETGRTLPNDEGSGRGTRPVINISWNDASAYAQWLGGKTDSECKLPSESQWEYAARAGTTTKYSWGGEIGENNANCDGCGSRWDDVRTAPVGSFPANTLNLHDMHGNVSEWVEDCWHDSYQFAPRDGSAWLGENGGDCAHVHRGGSWLNSPDSLRSSFRFWGDPVLRSFNIGFRVVCRPH